LNDRVACHRFGRRALLDESGDDRLSHAGALQLDEARGIRRNLARLPIDQVEQEASLNCAFAS